VVGGAAEKLFWRFVSRKVLWTDPGGRMWVVWGAEYRRGVKRKACPGSFLGPVTSDHRCSVGWSTNKPSFGVVLVSSENVRFMIWVEVEDRE